MASLVCSTQSTSGSCSMFHVPSSKTGISTPWLSGPAQCRSLMSVSAEFQLVFRNYGRGIFSGPASLRTCVPPVFITPSKGEPGLALKQTSDNPEILARRKTIEPTRRKEMFLARRFNVSQDLPSSRISLVHPDWGVEKMGSPSAFPFNYIAEMAFPWSIWNMERGTRQSEPGAGGSHGIKG